MDAYRSYNQPPPVLTVVIVWRDLREGIESCLRSLLGQVAQSVER